MGDFVVVRCREPVKDRGMGKGMSMVRYKRYRYF